MKLTVDQSLALPRLALGSYTPQQIAHYLGRLPGRAGPMTRTFKALERRGLIRILKDGRGKITAAGRKELSA